MVNLKENKSPKLFVNSNAVRRPIPNPALYCVSKSLLKGFTNSLKQEVNESGIPIRSVYPGKTTSIMKQILHLVEKKHMNR